MMHSFIPFKNKWNKSKQAYTLRNMFLLANSLFKITYEPFLMFLCSLFVIMASFIFTAAMILKKEKLFYITHFTIFQLKMKMKLKGFFFPMVMVLMFPQQPKDD